MAYSSGEFRIPQIDSIPIPSLFNKRSAVVFKNKLHMVTYIPGEFAGPDPMIQHTMFDMNSHLSIPNSTKTGTDKIDTASLTNPKNWKSTKLTHIEDVFVHTAISLTANKDYLWAFYGQQLGVLDWDHLTVKKYTPVDSGEQETGWSKEIKLIINGDGSNPEVDLLRHVQSVSATAFGENQIIVAAIVTQPKEALFLGVFDINDIDEDNNWKVKSYRWLDVNKDFKYYGIGSKEENNHLFGPSDDNKFLSFGDSVDIEWFSTVNKNKASLDYHLAITINPIITTEGSVHLNIFDDAYGFIPLSLNQKTGDIITPLNSDPISCANPPREIMWRNSSLTLKGGGLGASLARDPSGRLRSYSLAPNYTFDDLERIDSLYINTSEAPSPENLFGVKAYQGISYKTGKGPVYLPSGAFFVYADGKTTKEIDAPTIDNNTKKVSVDVYPVLEFTFYGEMNKCQVNYYGSITVIKDTKKVPEDAASIISGMMDVPIPFPIENYKEKVLTSNPTLIGKFAYGNEDESENEFTSEQSWNAGFKASGKTTEGIGPAFDIAINGGMGSVDKKIIKRTFKNDISVNASVSKNDTTGENEAEANGSVKVAASIIHLTGYQFKDAKDRILNDALSSAESAAPKNVNFQIMLKDALKGQIAFEPYSVTPGELESYTIDAWNERMHNLGMKPYEGEQNLGVEFYKGTDYYKEIICANAFNFGTDEDEKLFLEFSWAEGNDTTQSMELLKSKFTEQQWKFEAEIYAGVSGGGGIDFFGMGEEFETEFLAGGSYSSERSVGDTKASKWGLEISDFEVFPRKDLSGSVKAYTFRAFFLPVPKATSNIPPNYWTCELIKNAELGSDVIDYKSCCWRLVFVVTDIEYND